MEKWGRAAEGLRVIPIAAAILVGLYLSKSHSFLLFHSLAEGFCIVIAVGVFMLAWNSRRFIDNNYLLFLGIAYLFIGFLDFVHTISYQGMGVLQGYRGDLQTQIWIITRYLDSLTLFLAPFFLGRRLKVQAVMASYLAVTVLVLVITFYWDIFPLCFVEGKGVTPFKSTSEYIISVIFLASLGTLYRKRNAFDTHVFGLLVVSIVMSIASELSFARYFSLYGSANLVGHLFKIGAYYLIYRAIIETGLTKPYDLLFRNLIQSKDALEMANLGLEKKVAERTAELTDANEQLRLELVERGKSAERIERQLQHLGALRTIDHAIVGSLDLRITLHVILDQAASQLGVDVTDVWLLDSHTRLLEYAAGRGFRTSTPKHTRLSLGEGYAGQVALNRSVLHIPDLCKQPEFMTRPPIITEERFVVYFGVPLIARGQVKGVLEVFHRSPIGQDQEWVDFLEALAGQAAIAIDNATLFSDLEKSHTDLMQAYDSTLEGWSRALDLRDKETEGHSRRVTEAAERLARRMGIMNNELASLRRGALLHDIGKMGVPDSILLKPEPLDEHEWRIMKNHTTYAYELLSPIAFLGNALDIPYCHHEKWDGSGYPRGLKGEQIPLSARVFALVDVVDALRSNRPYRAGWPEEKIIAYLREQSGKHFDPKVVATFLDMHEAGKIYESVDSTKDLNGT